MSTVDYLTIDYQPLLKEFDIEPSCVTFYPNRHIFKTEFLSELEINIKTTSESFFIQTIGGCIFSKAGRVSLTQQNFINVSTSKTNEQRLVTKPLWFFQFSQTFLFV